MKRIICILVLLISIGVVAQQGPVKTRAKNLVIITLDGLRWQELFKGMDSALANNPDFNQDDSLYIYKQYWHPDPLERRKKLFPFIWSTVAKNGMLAGNREFDSRVDCSNPYWFSFPGYSEIFTGYADSAVNSNDHPPNANVNVLEHIHRQPGFMGKVVAFGAWHAFDRILNEKRAGFPVINAFDSTGGASPNQNEKLINRMRRDSYRPWLDAECLDVFTHYSAMEWLKTRKPRVLYIAYGETDEWAHSGMYRSYLDAARQTDQWIGELWNWLQSQPQYRNETTLFITTDHGRGDAIKKEWTSHNRQISGAGEIWFAAMGPGVRPRGEYKSHSVFYQAQFAQTFVQLLGLPMFNPAHPVASGLGLLSHPPFFLAE